MNKLDGQKFGRWTVLNFAGTDSKKNAVWECRCECGSAKKVVGYSLTGGKSLSCGCLTREAASRSNSTHGQTGTRTFAVWTSMKSRCCNPKNKRFARYGGRGITVCDRWLDSFENFLADMGDAIPPLQLDRIDNDKGYSPENCRWASLNVQGRNKSTNTRITINGVTKCLVEWCEEYSIRPATVLQRVRRTGATWEKALTDPTKRDWFGAAA